MITESVKKLVETFTPQERSDAQDAIADRQEHDPPYKPSGYYGLPLDKAWALDAELAKTQPPKA
jgi:hypothetical protein